jgi:inner membrane protein
MASVFGHVVVAGALGAAFYRRGVPARFWVLGAACSVVPDGDVIGVPLGVPIFHVLGHRGISHSLLFAVALAAVVVPLFFRRVPEGVSHARLWLYFFLATASHGVLDALTNGGPGVAFFVPLHNGRYFFAFRPIEVSPLGIRPFFSEWGRRVIASELVWVGIPALLFSAACVWRRARG